MPTSIDKLIATERELSVEITGEVDGITRQITVSKADLDSYATKQEKRQFASASLRQEHEARGVKTYDLGGGKITLQ